MNKYLLTTVCDNGYALGAQVMIYSISKNLKNFENFSKDEIYDHRKSKFLQIGRDQGFNKSSTLSEGNLTYKDSHVRKLVKHIQKNKLVYGGLGLVALAALIALIT